ncbi:MAG TPA: hypothetical protein VMR02_21015 [Terracidiphilus sp.]|jgi:Flp pilus assembly pilin Flp|nr:hypothetical protein [Terracidiphilus sp.]
MKSTLLALLRDESSQDSVEYALVILLLVLSVLALAKSLSHRNRAMFTAVFLSPQASLSGIVDAIQKAGKERNALLQELRLALKTGKNAEALELARELCGLVDRNEKSY